MFIKQENITMPVLNIENLNNNEMLLSLIDVQKQEVKKDVYKYKTEVTYVGGDINRQNRSAMSAMSENLIKYEDLFIVVASERILIVLSKDIKKNLIKRIIGKHFKVVEARTNIEEQLRLINRKENETFVDKRLYEKFKVMNNLTNIKRSFSYKNFEKNDKLNN